MLEPTIADFALDRFVALEVAGLVLLPDRGPRLYHRDIGAAFTREGSVAGALVELDGAAMLEFSLPAGTVDHLRFDLPAIAGCYRMGPVVIDGVRVEDLARRVVMVHGQHLREPESTSEVRVADWSSAPWFELDVRDLLGVAGRTGTIKVRIAVRKEHAAIEMERRLDAVSAEFARQLQSHGNAIRCAMDEVAASASLAQLAAHDRLHADVLEAHARIDRMGDETSRALAAQSESFRQELAALRQHLDAARSQLDFLTQYELNRSLVRRALRKVKRAFWK